MLHRTLRGCGVLALLCVVGCSSVYMKGTPLYTGEYSKPQAPPEQRVNVWPILYYHEPALSILWPVAEKTDDHVAVRPLFSVYKLDKEKQEWNVAWPLAEFDFDSAEHHVLPFFWGEDYFVAFPLVWWYSDVQGVLPFFWWDTGFTAFPLVWVEKDKHCHVFPLWLHSREGKEGGHDTWVLWPIFRSLKTEKKQGFHVWPLVGSYVGEEDRYRFALWPLCHDHRDVDERTRVAFPFYFEHTNGEQDWWLAVPAAFRWKEGEGDGGLITPLWSSGKSGDLRWSALAPLFYHSANPTARTRTLVTPLVGRLEEGDRTEWALMPALSSVAWGKGEKDIWLLAPLVHARWGGEKLEHHVLPLYYYDRNEKLFLSPLASWKGGQKEPFVNIAVVGAHYRRDSRDRRRLALAWPFLHATWGGPGDKTGFALFPVFSWNHSIRDYEFGPEKKRTRVHRDATDTWLFPWLYHSVSDTTETPPNAKPGQATRRRKRGWGAFPFIHYSHVWRSGTAKDPKHETTRADFRLLSFLYDYRLRKGMKDKADPKASHDYLRSRILWRVMHYEVLDGDESLDLVPFITWDRKKDGYRKFSFLWRFYRNERTADGGRNLDLLFIPIVRSKGGQAGG